MMSGKDFLNRHVLSWRRNVPDLCNKSWNPYTWNGKKLVHMCSRVPVQYYYISKLCRCVWQTKSGHVTLAPQRPVYRPVTPSSSQKFVVMATPPPPSATLSSSSSSTLSLAGSTSGTSGSQVMRMLSPTTSNAAVLPAAATTTKLVVVTTHSSTDTFTL